MFPSNHRFREFKRIVEGIPKVMRTSEFESKLLAFARQIGIQIQLENVSSTKAVAQQLACKIIVGSDGSHSMMNLEDCWH